MSELEMEGYRMLRRKCRDTWRYLGVFDVNGIELMRLDMETDPRITRTMNDATREIEIECRVRGSDSEISYKLPVRIAATELFPAATGGEYRTKSTYSPTAIADLEAGGNLIHTVHIPVDLLTEAI